MSEEQVNRVSAIGLIVFSMTALLPLLTVVARAIVTTGHLPPPDRDEGTGAHIFQLSLAALVPTGLAFLATSDWSQPSRIVRRLVFPTAAVVLALAVLYYWEHAGS
jgi:hypothetical protein